MKTINSHYLFTEKDGTPEEIFKAVSNLPQDYLAVIVSQNLSFLESAIVFFNKNYLPLQQKKLYKQKFKNGEYTAYLHKNDEHLTHLWMKDGSNGGDWIKNEIDILNLLNDCLVAFSSRPLKKIEYLLKTLSYPEEKQHPAMSIPLGLIFTVPPVKAFNSLIQEFDEKPYYMKVFENFIIQSQEWCHSNHALVMELLKLCPNIYQPDPSDPRRTMAEDFYITEEIEDRYLGKHLDNQDYLKRIKILAAFNAKRYYEVLQSVMQSEDTLAVATFMFLLTRSMAQFAANKAVDAGLRQHASRKEGGGKGVDRTGLLELVRRFNEKYPFVSPRDLWKILRDFLNKKKIFRSCKGYSVKFQIEPTDMDDTGGTLVQLQSGKETHHMQFQAFINMLSDIRK